LGRWWGKPAGRIRLLATGRARLHRLAAARRTAATVFVQLPGRGTSSALLARARPHEPFPSGLSWSSGGTKTAPRNRFRVPRAARRRCVTPMCMPPSSSRTWHECRCSTRRETVGQHGPGGVGLMPRRRPRRGRTSLTKVLCRSAAVWPRLAGLRGGALPRSRRPRLSHSRSLRPWSSLKTFRRSSQPLYGSDRSRD